VKVFLVILNKIPSVWLFLAILSDTSVVGPLRLYLCIVKLVRDIFTLVFLITLKHKNEIKMCRC